MFIFCEPHCSLSYIILQLAVQVELARREALREQKEYDELVQWLDQADDLLKIVDRPVHDRQDEFKVGYIRY